MKPYRMIRGSGKNAATYYNCNTVERACDEGAQLLVAKHTATGEMYTVPTDARMVHRRNIRATWSDAHERAGEGKFINFDAFTDDAKTRLVGAQHVNPYLHGKKPYATIIEVFQSKIGRAMLSGLKAKVERSRVDSDHLVWDGRRTADGFVVASPWMTADEFWHAACKFNPELRKVLRNSKSGRQDVKEYGEARKKFFDDVDVLRRARCVVNMSNGEREMRGGATPCAMPLEQVEFAIDKAYLTRGVVDGEEIAEYHWRLAIGRREPHILRAADWQYEDSTSNIAFLNEKVKLAAQRAAKQSARRASRAA